VDSGEGSETQAPANEQVRGNLTAMGKSMLVVSTGYIISVLDAGIRSLPMRSREGVLPSNNGSHSKTSNGLAWHIRDCAIFLQCIGPSHGSVCILLPCGTLLNEHYYITQILSIKYEAVVMENLAFQIASLRECVKMDRRERTIHTALYERNLDVVR
jgi:hypothetical protein